MSSRLLTRSTTPGRIEAMDLRQLQTLIDLFQQSGIAELEITEGEEKVRISRGVTGGAAHVMPQPGTVYMTAPMMQPAEVSAPAAAEAVTPGEPEGHVVKAPMVG